MRPNLDWVDYRVLQIVASGEMLVNDKLYEHMPREQSGNTTQINPDKHTAIQKNIKQDYVQTIQNFCFVILLHTL